MQSTVGYPHNMEGGKGMCCHSRPSFSDYFLFCSRNSPYQSLFSSRVHTSFLRFFGIKLAFLYPTVFHSLADRFRDLTHNTYIAWEVEFSTKQYAQTDPFLPFDDYIQQCIAHYFHSPRQYHLLHT